MHQLGLLFGLEGTIYVLKTSQLSQHQYKVNFNHKMNAQSDHDKLHAQIRDNKLKHVYGIMEIYDASPSSAAIIEGMAPPPPSVAPFLLPHRFTVFFTVCPPEDCLLVVPHVDQHGSGPLVHGPSEIGSCTSVAVCAPDYSKKKESIPPEINNVFTPNAVPIAPSNKTTKNIHVVNINVSGAHINLPAGCWHALRIHGSSIRVGYFFSQRM